MQTLPSSKEILLHVLSLIDYKDDKEKFAKEFLTTQLQQAFVSVIDHLSESQKKDLEVKLANNPSDAEIYQLLQGYLTPKVYTSVFLQSIQQFFAEYIKTIMPLLTNEKKQALQNYLASIAQEFQQAVVTREMS